MVAALADRYAAFGVEPVILAWGDEERACQAGTHAYRALRGWNGLERYDIPVPIVEPVSSWRRIGKTIARCDGVHVHGLPYPACALALIQARRLRRPAIVTEHVGTVPYDRALVNVGQALALRVTASLARRTVVGVTVLNDRVADELRPLLGPLEITKIPNGVDTRLFSTADFAQRQHLRRQLGFEQPTVVSVGRNVPKKGFRHLVRALELSDTFNLFLIGAGTSVFTSERCRTAEYMDQAELADVYRASDLLALASEGEGLPLVVQEALASGLPVVMGDDPAVRAELPSGPVTFVPASDARALHDGICDVLRRPDLESIRSCARDQAVARFDWSRTAASYLGLLGIAPTSSCGPPSQSA